MKKTRTNMSIARLLEPKSIAVIGATQDTRKIGGRLLNNLMRHGFRGKVYPVNPKYPSIGDNKCFADIKSLPGVTDVALIAVPADGVARVLEDLGKNRITHAIVFSSGFSEAGKGGAERQNKLLDIVGKYGIAICGPNSVGVINFNEKTAMSFSQFLEVPELVPGRIGFISQSGALGGSLLNRAQDSGIGTSIFISSGNEAVLSSADYLEYLVEDKHTDAIVALIEDIKNAEKFIEVCQIALQKNKPIFIMKIGKTEAGKKAAASHTGSMAGSDEAYSAVFRYNGVIRLDDLDDLYVVASSFLKTPPPKGRRVGIITSTGGGGIILADKLEQAGMDIPSLSETSKEKLHTFLPSFASVRNPFDLTAQLINDPNLFRQSMDVFGKDRNFDSIVVATSMVAGQLSAKRAHYINEASEVLDKPVVTWWAAGSLSSSGISLLQQGNVPFFSSAQQCVTTLTSLIQYQEFKKKWRERPPARAHRISHFVQEREFQEILNTPSHVITEYKGKKLLSFYGIPITKEGVAGDVEEAKKIADEIGYPVAVKILSPKITHKTDAGGIVLDVRDEKSLEKAFRQVIKSAGRHDPDAGAREVLIQEMVTDGIELIIGMKNDFRFGPLVMIGLGGIYTEVYKDFAMRPAPLNEIDAQEMLTEMKAFAMLVGARGKKKADLEIVKKTLVGVSTLALDLRYQLGEIDINPFVVFEDGRGAKVVDCLFIKNNYISDS